MQISLKLCIINDIIYNNYAKYRTPLNRLAEKRA